MVAEVISGAVGLGGRADDVTKDMNGATRLGIFAITKGGASAVDAESEGGSYIETRVQFLKFACNEYFGLLAYCAQHEEYLRAEK